MKINDQLPGGNKIGPICKNHLRQMFLLSRVVLRELVVQRNPKYVLHFLAMDAALSLKYQGASQSNVNVMAGWLWILLRSSFPFLTFNECNCYGNIPSQAGPD